MGVPSKALAETDAGQSLPATQSFEFASDRIAKAFEDQRGKDQASYSSREYKKATKAVMKMTLSELEAKYNFPQHPSVAVPPPSSPFFIPLPSSKKVVKEEKAEEEKEKEVVPVHHPWKRDRLRKIIMDNPCSKNTE